VIKKTTQAIFHDGPYAGSYDWQGGIPLSEGEEMKVTIRKSKEVLIYVLTKKEIEFCDEGDDQIIKIVYHFELK